MGVRKFHASPSAMNTDSYMLSHARKAAAAMPSGSPESSKFSFMPKPNTSGETVLSAVQRKAQQQLSPLRPEPGNNLSHVDGEYKYLAHAQKVKQNDKHVNGVTSVWNKFSDASQTKVKDGSSGYQGIDSKFTVAAIDAGKATHRDTVSPHVGVKGKIDTNSYENAFAISAYKWARPANKEVYIGVTPKVPADDFTIREYKEKHEVIRAHQNFVAPASKHHMGADSYMLLHSKKTAPQPAPLVLEKAARTPPKVAPGSYELMHAQAARDAIASPDAKEYVGKKAYVDNDSYAMEASRRAAEAIESTRPRETKNRTPIKGASPYEV